MCGPPDGQSAPSALETCSHEIVMPPLAAWETQARIARGLPGLEEAAAVTHAEPADEAEACEAIGEERCDEHERDEPCLRQIRHLLPLLEANVLERFGGHPEELGRPFVIPPSSCQVAACNPRCRAVAS